MPPSPADVQRWLKRFEAVEAVERRERRKPRDPAESIRLPLSSIAALFDAAGGRAPFDPLRHRDEEAVRAVWARLRQAAGPTA